MTTNKKKQEEAEHTVEDSIAEVKAISEEQSRGGWMIVTPPSGLRPGSGQHVANFVRYSERDQYNLMTTTEYKTEEAAKLAIAILTRPFALTLSERMQILDILGGKS